MQVLHIDSNILSDASASRPLSVAIVDELRRGDPSTAAVHRDLSIEAVPHLDDAITAGFRAMGADDFDGAARTEHARSETLVNELFTSDVIVAGVPMYNFLVLSQLRAWIDRVTQTGHTLKYTETGPVRLAGGKKVTVMSTRNGMYSAGPAVAMDSQEAYLRTVFGFSGITDMQLVHAERLAMGSDARAQALEAAHAAVRDIVSRAVAA